MTVGMIGYGRFGQLWANMVGHQGYQVRVYDKKAILSDNDLIEQVTLEKAVRSRILFLCVPISAIESCCRQIAELLDPRTIVVDVCSVKIHPVRIMRQYCAPTQPIIGTHPLFGPDSVARSGGQGHAIAVCPVRVSEKQAIWFEQLLDRLGLSVIYTPPDAHDMQMARSQALVHFIGRGLEDLGLEQQEISTPDYQSLLRMNTMVRHDTQELFFDMQQYNPYAKDMRLKLLHSLQRLQRQIGQQQ